MAAGKEELSAEVIGHRLAELRRAQGLPQAQVAQRMGVTKGRISQIEQGKISGQDVLARFAAALRGGCTRRSTSTTATSRPSPERTLPRAGACIVCAICPAPSSARSPTTAAPPPCGRRGGAGGAGRP